MTRSLGMHLSSSLGIICEPEHVKLKIRPTFKYILIGSDGFWDVFSNEEALNFLKDFWDHDCLPKGMCLLFE